ncbi:FMN-binding negative transcriptional regulator [Undibacterium sp. RTI2.1]|uniref:FMN-binding negative transcriptional regulator n=1 Tax=unclassified Undibacterium TaxID=2630295 RepID=UPI002AB3F7B6|nr:MULTISPECIES: FMN-binding negative transcriptional regulator [unclassified Undibacterium]MDY7538110.1 FMN-binding negative transcriptional regulator [Undibacterium sp. 5I1]MEB0033122.1 FMN-binding negative transcriptional regulator [Undibacterium sp. RTI2.1]MEB0118700.1 FMN-binding negative transcriptional regulator [Undibacterium sp. RTI2.2]MEB0232578.1 FMN-binding negative transcriptional regulator [Undibacterium sp. 10I3]MEB0259603.1 FMN-binding negative transcriptional regulator [Undiba
MYLPTHFQQNDPALLLEVMRRYNFVSLVCNVDGVPFASHVPVLAEEYEGQIIIDGHLALPNPQWKAIEAGTAMLAIFHGPHTYVSPSLYQPGNRVPTWDYIAVHATGTAQTLHDADSKLAVLGKLIQHHEPDFQTRFDDMPTAARDGLLKGIVAFRIKVEKLEGKFKLGQHRIKDDIKGAKQSLYQTGDDNQQDIAAWMQRLGYWDKD